MQKISSKELLALYSEGKRDFGTIDLSGSDLFEANLEEIGLAGSNLTTLSSGFIWGQPARQ